jgi:hypothetical protein
MSLFDDALAFGEETTYNVEAPRTRFLPLVTDGIKPRRQKIENKGRRAGSRFPLPAAFSIQGAEGAIEWVPETNGLGFMLKHMLGNLVTAAGVVGGTWTHTATPGDPTGRSLSYESNRPFANGSPAVVVATGGKFKSWKLAMDLNGMLTASGSLSFASWRQDAAVRTASTTVSTAVTMASTAGITAGMRVTGANIAPNTTVASVTNSTTLVLSLAATGIGTQPLVFGLAAQEVMTGTWTVGSSIVVASTTGLAPGQPVYGAGIAPGSVIATVTNATTFVVSPVPTGAGTAAEIVIGLAPTTPAYLAAEPFPFDRTTAAITWNGATTKTLDLLSFSIEADMGIVDRQTMPGFKEPVPGANAGIKVTASVEWESWDEYRRFNASRQADTIAGFDLTFAGTNPITGLTMPSLRIQTPAVQLEGATPDQGDGVLKQDLTGMIVTPASGVPLTLTALTGSATP